MKKEKSSFISQIFSQILQNDPSSVFQYSKLNAREAGWTVYPSPSALCFHKSQRGRALQEWAGAGCTHCHAWCTRGRNSCFVSSSPLRYPTVSSLLSPFPSNILSFVASLLLRFAQLLKCFFSFITTLFASLFFFLSSLTKFYPFLV